ncbi:MAG: transcriptional repressor LexA [Ardenticatenaceae bacterium]|nr:transcriptional repressor LexA [Ardenticatenaceae bacterium]
MSKEKPLSERQQNILNYIGLYVGENDRPPTIREIGAATSISSTSVVNYNLGKLEEKGLIERESDVSRGLRLTEKARAFVQYAVNHVNRMLQIPMLGQIVAGKPIEVGNDSFDVFDEDDAVEVSATMLGSKKTDDLYALRVSGESMIDAMVNDGDIVIMRRQETAQNGDMVAVWIDSSGTTTLKHFYHEGKRVRLQPANPTMEPIYVPTNDVRIQGKVMMVLRQTA